MLRHCVPGQDHEEAGPSFGVWSMQAPSPGAHQEDQALRAGRRQEEEGADDPVLKCIRLFPVSIYGFIFLPPSFFLLAISLR